MKIKILFFVLGAGLILASCSDKEGAAKMKQMEADMHAADSVCQATTKMLTDSIMGYQHVMDSIKMAAEMRSSMSTSSTKTTTKSTTPVSPTTGTKKNTNLTPKTGNNVDIHKKGGATGGN